MSSIEALARAFVYSPILAIYLCVATNLGFILLWLSKAFMFKYNKQISQLLAPVTSTLKNNPMIKKYWIPLGVLLSLFINLLVSAKREEASTLGTIVMVLSVWLIPGLFLYLVIQLMIATFPKIFAK